MEGDLEQQRRHIFTWKIENFSSCIENVDECFVSPIFTTESLNGTKWVLNLYPRGYAKRKEYITCFLSSFYDDTVGAEIECRCNISVDGFENLSTNSNQLTYSPVIRRSYIGPCYLLQRDLFLRNTFFSEDILSIRCVMTFNETKIVPLSKNVGWTKIRVDKYSFKWNSKDINTTDFEEIVQCPSFVASLFELIVLIPEDDIQIKIRRIKAFTLALSVVCKISLLDVKNKEQDYRQTSYLFEPLDFETWEFPVFLKKSKLNSEKDKYLNNGSFTLHYEISISNGKYCNSIKEKNFNPSKNKDAKIIKNLTTLQNDLLRLHQLTIHTDMKFRVDNKIFPAHKCILSSRSPVFLAMFEQDMVENKTGLVDICDFDVETVDLLLQFMYTGIVKELNDKRAISLFLAADKYQILSLKEMCSDFLTCDISNKNVCDILICIDMVQDDKLKTLAYSYIKENARTFFASEEWKTFVKENPKLATNIVLKVSIFIEFDFSSHLEK